MSDPQPSKKQRSEVVGNARLLSFIAGSVDFPEEEFRHNPFVELNSAGQNLFQLLPSERFSEIPLIWDSPTCLVQHPQTGQTVYHYGAERGFLKYCPPHAMTLEAMESCDLWGESPIVIAGLRGNLDQIGLEFLTRHLENGGSVLADLALAGRLHQVPQSLQTPEYAARRCPRNKMNLVQAAAAGKCLRDVAPQHLTVQQLQALGVAEANAYELAAESGCLDQLAQQLLTFPAMATFNAFGHNPSQIAALNGHLDQIPPRFRGRLLYLAQQAPDPSSQKYISHHPIQGYGGNLGHCAAAGQKLGQFPKDLQSDQVFDQKNADGNLVAHLAAMHSVLHQINPHWLTPKRLTAKNNAGHTVLTLCSAHDMDYLLQVPGLTKKCAQHLPKDWWGRYHALHNKVEDLRVPDQAFTSIELF